MMVTASFVRRESIQVVGPFADEATKIINSMKMNNAKLPNTLTLRGCSCPFGHDSPPLQLWR